MTSLPDEPRRLAKRLLSSGIKVPDIERLLVERGIDPTTASQIVDEAMQSKLSANSVVTPGRSFSWVRIVLGLATAAVAFVGIYIALVNAPDGVLMGLGASRGAIRGGIICGGGGLAVGALNVVRSELMLLIHPEG